MLNPNWLGRLAAYHPNRPALWFRNTWLTYGELYLRARRAAGALRALGVAKGDRVGLIAWNHPAYLDLLFAGPLLGHILTPFNHRLSLPELKALHAYTEPKVLFYGEGFQEVAQALDPKALPLEVLLQGEEAPEEVRVDLEDPALLLFTGGTTGLPKGALLPYRQLLVNALETAFAWGLSREDRYILATPMFHAALNALATPLLYLGGQVVVEERFRPEEYLELVRLHRPTLLFLVPTMYQMLLEAQAFAETDLSSVRFAISGGAPCPAPVREAFRKRGVRFKQGYGLTECGVNCFTFELEEAERYPESVGRPMPHLWARLVREDGKEAGVGEAGELWLSGGVVMKGYFRRPEENERVFVWDGERLWLRTGDLAYRDEGGRFYIVGRRKEMFISGGENVYPVEVERVLYDHPAVKEAAVVGVPDPRWGEVGAAFVVLREPVPAEALRAFLKARLAGYKVPKHLIFLEELPKTGPGKVQKEALKRLWEERYGQA
ncbi:long-chain-fatty-acid--CoA ligase [Thermus thermophilus]|uniref:Long-chain-fatty-acid--CoA ligase n=1 Tax=Thermus thermophilus TaxID=274 RepID=A0AAD1KTI7_THETH|nr:AMP-binding protein [Thermus thermophilus]BCZ86583.1 long-chain-fatty-acid--CoA ligase [Thermus thermophilus]BCZ91597.1 long-chain-fatty-acid--CoA ligase [Thermus thermophilus]BCZ94140.1 long-chain-fatty-acid--CoA ligase [Thermus thermophilus]